MEHFIKRVMVTKDKPMLRLLDNHQSHLTVREYELAKGNRVVLSFPYHTTETLIQVRLLTFQIVCEQRLTHGYKAILVNYHSLGYPIHTAAKCTYPKEHQV
jgi:hypothetical protein